MLFDFSQVFRRIQAQVFAISTKDYFLKVGCVVRLGFALYFCQTHA